MQVRKDTMRLTFLSLSCALAMASAPAAAQGAFDMGMLTNTLAQGSLVETESARAAGASAFRSITRTPRNAAVDITAVRYRPSMAVRKRNMAQIVKQLGRADPANAEDLERTLARRDLVAEIGSVMRPVGLDPNNVADAVAVYLVTAYYGVRGSTDSQPAEYKAVSAQVARALGADPGFTGASDGVKQEIAEAMLVHAVLADQAVEAARKQPSAMPAVKAAIAKGARHAFGLDLARMQLGPAGLN